MATYVMTDIHGMYDSFKQMLDKINFTPSDYLLILGDNVDRGPNSMALLEHIHNNPNIESLMGNHELMMLNDMFKLGYPRNEVGDWYANGGRETLRDFLTYSEKHGEEKALNLLKTCLRWKFHKFLTVNGRKFLCVHAGYYMAGLKRYQEYYKSDPEVLLADTSDIEKVWMREDFYWRRGLPGITTLFGHTPTQNLHGSPKIWHDPHYNDKIDLDCGVAYGGKLSCLRLDDMQEFYV